MKNKWNFRWIEEEVQVKKFTVKIGDSINKVNLPGKASCSLCHSVINYGGRGKSAFKEHLLSDMHYTKLKTQKSNYSLYLTPPHALVFIFGQLCVPVKSSVVLKILS